MPCREFEVQQATQGPREGRRGFAVRPAGARLSGTLSHREKLGASCRVKVPVGRRCSNVFLSRACPALCPRIIRYLHSCRAGSRHVGFEDEHNPSTLLDARAADRSCVRGSHRERLRVGRPLGVAWAVQCFFLRKLSILRSRYLRIALRQVALDTPSPEAKEIPYQAGTALLYCQGQRGTGRDGTSAGHTGLGRQAGATGLCQDIDGHL